MIAALYLLTERHNVYTELATFGEMKKKWVDSTVCVSKKSDSETVIFVNVFASRPPLGKTMMFLHLYWRVKYFIFIHVDINHALIYFYVLVCIYNQINDVLASTVAP